MLVLRWAIVALWATCSEKSTDSWNLDLKLILNEKSVRNACRQMQTVWVSNLRTMSMFGLILKNNQFLKKTDFFTNNGVWSWAEKFLYQISCNQWLKKKRIFWIVFDSL